MPITNAFDWLAIAIAALLIAFAAKRGFVAEIFSAAAIIGGFACALAMYPVFYGMLHGIHLAPQAKTLTAFIIAYIIFGLGIWGIGWIIGKIVQITMLGWINHILGGVIGLVKACIVISLFVIAIKSQPSKDLRHAFVDSHVYAFFSNLPFNIKIPTSSMIDQGEKLIESFNPAGTHLPDVGYLLENHDNDSTADSTKVKPKPHAVTSKVSHK